MGEVPPGVLPPPSPDYEADKPAVNMPWYSAVRFANRLSIKHGLRPFYSLKAAKILADGKDLPDGLSLTNPSANGYRFASTDQLTYAIKTAVTARGLPLDFNQDNMDDYLWHYDNSNEQIRPVGELLDLLLTGSSIALSRSKNAA